MLSAVTYFVGALFGGMLVTALIGWALIRAAKLPKGLAFFLAWAGACLIATWGMAGDGDRWPMLLIAYAAYGLGAWLNYLLSMRAESKAQDVADFE